MRSKMETPISDIYKRSEKLGICARCSHPVVEVRYENSEFGGGWNYYCTNELCGLRWNGRWTIISKEYGG